MTKADLIEAVQRGNKDLSKRAVGEVGGDHFFHPGKVHQESGPLCLPGLWGLYGKKPEGPQGEKSANGRDHHDQALKDGRV